MSKVEVENQLLLLLLKIRALVLYYYCCYITAGQGIHVAGTPQDLAALGDEKRQRRGQVEKIQQNAFDAQEELQKQLVSGTGCKET